VTAGSRGADWTTFVDMVAAFPAGTLWRHNQAGDLPGNGSTIDPVALGSLVAANAGRRGFTYTHYRDADSIAWVRHANQWGFTVNLSGNDLADADRLADLEAGRFKAFGDKESLRTHLKTLIGKAAKAA
jgi:hypothetical protein